MMAFRSLFACLLACCLLSSAAVAYDVGPAAVAKTDRHLWPAPVDAPAGFDAASRAAILIYAKALADMGMFSDAEMRDAFKIKSIDRAAVDTWLHQEQDLLLANYRQATQDCAAASDWTCLGSADAPADLLRKAAEADRKMPPPFLAWRDSFRSFARAYAAEQLRLAALFSKVSSEIALFGSNEWNGNALADRQFFLTFDDGPTEPAGTTDTTAAMLAKEKKSAVFFVLGERLQQRLKKTDSAALAALYAKQCVGSHGWEHKSHAKWAQWQDSVTRTHALLHAVLSAAEAVPLFRPPYGQRTKDSGAFFQAQDLHVALWNLDSQDWNRTMDADAIVSRILALMLIKRHGVLLFHDVHPKAQAAVPVLLKELGNAVVWGDCHALAQP